MTKFSDQLYDDLMREHGPALAAARPPAAPKRHIPHRALLGAGAGGVAVAAAVGAFVATGGTPGAAVGTHVAKGGSPAYAVTKNPDGTVTLAVYQTSGIAGANARLHQLGEGQVVIVPVEPGCPSPSSLPPPAVPPAGPLRVQGSDSKDGGLTVNAQGIPAGDILVVGAQMTTNGRVTTTEMGSRLTSPPAPACISLTGPPLPPGSGVSKSG
jgi:hypothetical protein